MTTIGYAVLQIIPSLDGVSQSIDKQLGGTLRASGKAGGKQFARGAGEGLKDLKGPIEDAERAYKKLADKADDSLGKVRAGEAKLVELRNQGKQNTAQYIAAEERLNTTRRASDRAIRDAADGHASLLSAQKGLGDETQVLGGRFASLSGLAGTAGTALAGAGALAGGAALAGIAALGAGIVVAGRQLYDLGAQFDDLSDSLQVSTGLSGDALNGLKSAVEDIGTTSVPDTFENIGKVAAEVTRNLHLTGQPLEDVTSRLANLQRLGVDVNVQALGKAFRGFGVEVKDQVPALNGLYEASTKSGLSIDDMLASVTKFGAPLRALGFTFGESAALVTTFEDAGLDADKSLAGLQKGLANFAKDGKAGPDALRDAVTQIQKLAQAGDDAGAIDLSNKIFGAKGGVAFFDAIKNGSLDLQSLSDSLATTGLDINQVSDDTADWSERWQLLKNQAAQALEPLGSAVFNGVNEGLGELATWVENHKAEVIDFFVDVGQAAATMAEFTIRSFGLISEGLGQILAPITATVSAILRGVAAFERIGGFTDIADKLDGAADGMENFNSKLTDFGAQAKNFSAANIYAEIGKAGDAAKQAAANTDLLKNGIVTLPDGTVTIKDTTPENIQRVKDLGYAVTTLPNGQLAISVQYMVDGQPISLDQLRTPIRIAATPGGSAPTTGGGRAGGGSIAGPGGPTSDLIPIWASNGEHMLDAKDVDLMGGQQGVYAFRAALNAGALGKFAGGGAVGPDVSAAQKLVGTPYSQALRNDCSGSVAQVINATLGQTGGGLMSTKTAAAWLAARGFVKGSGGPGQISVGWYDHGPNPNDGHMAMTLSDGRNAESGGSHGSFLIGGDAKGANSPGFDQHMFLPTLYGEGPGAAGGPAAASAAPAGGGAPSPAPTASTGSGGGGGFSLPTSISGLASFGLGDLGKGVGTTKSGSDLSLFGKAAGSAVSGQIDSALGVFGINGAPPILQAASKLIGGIKVGGGGDSSPLSAKPNFTGAPPPDDAGNVHGSRAGQQPGPVYNIKTATTEDAFIKAQRIERERTAAKLSRF